MSLDSFLSGSIFAFIMIVARFGTAIMMMPGFGDIYVAPRIRLSLVIMIALILIPRWAARATISTTPSYISTNSVSAMAPCTGCSTSSTPSSTKPDGCIAIVRDTVGAAALTAGTVRR